MGRFSNLEGPAPGLPPTAIPDGSSAVAPAARDEVSCMRDADRAWRSGRPEQALRLYSRALEFDPNLASAWAGQARMLLELGEITEAKLWSSKALELFREHPDLLACRAIAELRLGATAEAQAWSDAAIGTRQPGALPWLARAEVMIGLGMGSEDHCLRKAVERGGDAWTRVLASRLCLVHGRQAAALDWAREAASAEPRLAPAWFAAGLAAERLGLVDEAANAYQQAMRIDRDLPGLADAGARIANRSFFARVCDLFRGFRR